jgi:hypothetical protein
MSAPRTHPESAAVATTDPFPPDSATITTMEKDAMTTVIVSEGGRELVYRIVNGEAGDERLTIERVDEPALDEILAEEGSRRMSPDEFQAHFGQLPLTRNE